MSYTCAHEHKTRLQTNIPELTNTPPHTHTQINITLHLKAFIWELCVLTRKSPLKLFNCDKHVKENLSYDQTLPEWMKITLSQELTLNGQRG